MKSNLTTAIAVRACLIVTSVAPANANSVYDWTFADQYFGGSGTITLGSLDADQVQHPNGYDIIGITGTFGGSTIVKLTGFNGADNIFYPTGCSTTSATCNHNGSVLDSNGFAFSLLGTNSQWTIYDSPNSIVARRGDLASNFFRLTFTLQPTYTGQSGTFTSSLDAPVPGPIVGAGLPGLILAGSGLFGWWWRRKRKAGAMAAA